MPDPMDKDVDNQPDAADPLAHLPAAAGGELLRLSGPDNGIISTPRFVNAGSGPDEIRIRLIRKPDGSGVVVHITAPDPEIADAVVRRCFGDDQPYTIELCG